jgi:cell division protein FtsI/penicillin-binding protein 2
VVRARLKLLALLITLPFVAILARLAMLQLPAASVASYRRQSEHRMSRLDPPRRGRILASDGSPLATNRTVCQLHFRYSDLNPIDEALEGLIAVLAKDRAFTDAAGIQARMREMVDVPAFIRREVDAGPSEEPRWIRIVESIDENDAKELSRRWKDGAEVFQLRPGRLSGRSDVWFDPALVLQMEICLVRLARLLRAHEVPFGDLPARIAKELKGIERRVEDRCSLLIKAQTDQKLVEREAVALRRKERKATWSLVPEVPLAVVAQIECRPDLYPGIECVDSVLREYPGGEVCGLLTGWTQQIARDADLLEWAKKSEKLLPPLREISSLEEFIEHREGRFGRSDWVGIKGLEKTYDGDLRGAHGMTTWQTDAQVNLRGVIEAVPRQDGKDIRTTIDLPLQRKLYEALAAAIAPIKPLAAGGGTAGSAAVMDVASGALLASVGFPGVDANRACDPAYVQQLKEQWNDQTRSWFVDRPSNLPLFPGSVFKPFVAAAAMEAARPETAYTADLRYTCPHRFPLIPALECEGNYGHTPTHDVNLVEALQYSCNVYFYYLGLRHLGPERIRTWASNFGYGEPSGVDLPVRRSSSGRLAQEAPEPWQACHYAIGQGMVEATPLQVLRSYAALATGCTRVPTPYLVQPQPPKSLHIENLRTAEVVREGLWRAAHVGGGTAADEKFHLRRFDVALKTGTAEVSVKHEILNHAWLAGFAPSRNPRIAFVAVVEQTTLHGANATAPIVVKLLEHFADQAPDVYLLKPEGSP